mgnify:CR=1 FL=1
MAITYGNHIHSFFTKKTPDKIIIRKTDLQMPVEKNLNLQ